MRTGLFALGIAAGVAACSPALAQMMDVPVVEAKREMRFGASVAALYDSNISHTSTVTALARGIQPEDEVFTPSALFAITQPVGRNAAFLQGTAGYDFHRVNSRLNRENIDLTGGGLGVLGPCHGTGFGRYAAAQSNLEDLSLGVVQNLTQTSTGGGQVVCGKTRGFNVQMGGEHTQVVNSETRQKQADHRADQAALQVGYTNERLGALAAVFNYSHQDYPSRLTAKGGIGDSYWNNLLGINYTRAFGSKIKVQASAGKMTLKRASAPPGVPLKVTATNYAANLGYKMSNRLEFTLQASRAFQPSNRPGKLFDLVTHTEGTAAYNVGTRITVTLGGFVEEMSSNQDTTAIAGPTPTKSHKNAEYIQFRYRQSERLSALLDLRHEDRNTDLAAFNYSDTRATVTLATSF
jgi:hypothetical protein